jgi:rod shape-determining protein MreD
MSWLIFTLVVFVAFSLETGLQTLLAIPGPTGVAPSFLLVVAVFIGLLAPSTTVAWAFLIIGLLVDLQPGPVREGVILGPAALGYLVGGYTVVQLRTLVFRESVLTLAVMTFIVGVFIELVIVMLYTARGLPITPADPIAGWSAADRLKDGFLQLVYSAALAVPVGALLFRYAHIWAFPKGPRADRHF